MHERPTELDPHLEPRSNSFTAASQSAMSPGLEDDCSVFTVLML